MRRCARARPPGSVAGLLTLGMVLASPAGLSAHEGGSAAGLLSGLVHPISGFDHSRLPEHRTTAQRSTEQTHGGGHGAEGSGRSTPTTVGSPLAALPSSWASDPPGETAHA